MTPEASSRLLEAARDIFMAGVLARVHLHDLQALQQSSRLLRTIAQQAPEAVWMAAAATDMAPYHPALRSHDIRGYIAWHLARKAAFAAGGSSWPRRSVPCFGDRLDQGPQVSNESLSHDGQIRASITKSGPRLQVQHLQSGRTELLELAKAYYPSHQPKWRPDSGAVALLLWLRMRGPDQSKTAVVVVCTIADHTLYTAMINNSHECSCAHVSWAADSSKVCVQCISDGHSMLHIYDTQLTVLAKVAGPATSHNWNASSSGLLCARAVLLQLRHWHSLPLQGSVEAAVPDLVPDASDVEWGIWLPGTGEVMLASHAVTANQKLLSCWVPQCTDLVKLGDVLDFTGYDEWTSGLRHVALTNVYIGTLQLLRLDSGPKLIPHHSVSVGRYSSDFAFCPDGCYLLFSDRGIQMGGRRAKQGCLKVVEMASGASTSVLDLTDVPSNLDVSWVSGGIRAKEAQAYYFIDFVSLP